MAKRILALFLSIVMLFTITVSAQTGGVDGVYDPKPDTTYDDQQKDTEGEQQPEPEVKPEEQQPGAEEVLPEEQPKPPMMMAAPAVPVTADVYTLDDDTQEYTHIKGHGPNAPLDMKNDAYNTVYILASESDQNIYFECGTPWELGWIGAEYSLLGNNASWVPTELAADGKTIAGYVTVSAQAAPGTEIMLTAAQPGLFGEVIYTVYIQVLEELPEEELTEVVMPDGTTIGVAGVPEGGSLSVTGPDKNDLNNIGSFIDAQYDKDTAPEQGRVETFVGELFAYDISILNKDGEEWQPGDAPVTVTLEIPNLELGFYQKVCVAHLHDGEVKMLDDVVVDDVNKTITFTTDGFSAFYGFIVDFSFEGQSYVLSVSEKAKGSVSLSKILAAIQSKYKITDVKSVTSSNATYITAKQNDKKTDWTIASREVDGGFNVEVFLSVTMQDNATLKIRVLNPQVIFGLKGAHSNWNTAATTSKTVVPNTNTDASKNVTLDVINSAVWVKNEQYEKDSDDAEFGENYKIYMRPGMAWTVTHGISVLNPNTDAALSWNLSSYNGGSFVFNGWSWIYDGKLNYIVANDVDKYTVTEFDIKYKNEKNETEVRAVELHIIPYNTPELLSTYLNRTGNTEYSVVDVPASLFDYDGRAWNSHYASNGNYLAFSGSDAGVNVNKTSDDESGTSITRPWTDSDTAANGGGSNALMGIVKEELGTNGLPEMSQGQQVDLFGANSSTGKTAYSNIGFEFIYENATGYYNYNSELNHAQYNTQNKKIELYTQSLSPADANTAGMTSSSNNTKAGFYPFADIDEAFISKNALGLTVEEKLERLSDPVISTSRLSADVTKDFVSSSTAGSTVGMHFGVYVHSDFYLPKDKMLNGQHMIYEFTGDDDLWVFIDNKLVLDIGGGHTPVSGSFNLTTGDINVSNYSQLNPDNGGYYETQVNNGENLSINMYDKNDGIFKDDLAEDQMHSISIFYLERHSGESNCRMRFNLPLVPSNAVNVSKKLTNQDGLGLSVTPDVDYTFTLYTAKDGDDNCDAAEADFSVYADKLYTVTGTNAPTTPQKTDENGQFKLKDGWMASFTGIDRFTNVYVIEAEPSDDYEYAGHTVSVNKGTATNYIPGEKTETKVMQSTTSINFDFVNKMKTQPLVIEKKMASGLLNSEQQFTMGLDFTKPILETGAGAISATRDSENVPLTDGDTFTLQKDQRLEIPRVPVNMTYTVKEEQPSISDGISFDVPKFSLTIGSGTTTNLDEDNTAFGKNITEQTIQNGGKNRVTVTNLQRFTMTINKVITGEIKPDQSFMFDISKTGEATPFMTVVIPAEKFKADGQGNGSASVDVSGLPVDSYTVAENAEWSWRYTLVGDNNRSVDAANGGSKEVMFTNTRTKTEWLDGEVRCKNIFDATTPPQVEKSDPAYVTVKKKED